MTKQEKVAAWIQNLNFRWSQGGYWIHDKYGALAPDQATFFYEVVEEAELRGHIDEWLRLDQVVDFNKKRNKAVYRLQLPLKYVQTRTKELRHLKQEGKTNGL